MGVLGKGQPCSLPLATHCSGTELEWECHLSKYTSLCKGLSTNDKPYIPPLPPEAVGQCSV